MSCIIYHTFLHFAMDLPRWSGVHVIRKGRFLFSVEESQESFFGLLLYLMGKSADLSNIHCWLIVLGQSIVINSFKSTLKKSYVVREPLLILIEKGWMEVILIIILWCWISRHYRRGKWYRRYTGLFLGYYVLVDVFMRVWRIRSCGRTHHERCVVSEHYCRPVEAVHGICLPNGNRTFLLHFTRLRLYFSRL